MTHGPPAVAGLIGRGCCVSADRPAVWHWPARADQLQPPCCAAQHPGVRRIVGSASSRFASRVCRRERADLPGLAFPELNLRLCRGGRKPGVFSSASMRKSERRRRRAGPVQLPYYAAMSSLVAAGAVRFKSVRKDRLESNPQFGSKRTTHPWARCSSRQSAAWVFLDRTLLPLCAPATRWREAARDPASAVATEVRRRADFENTIASRQGML